MGVFGSASDSLGFGQGGAVTLERVCQWWLACNTDSWAMYGCLKSQDQPAYMTALTAFLRSQRGHDWDSLCRAGPGLDPVYHAIAVVSLADVVVVCHNPHVDLGARYFWAAGAPPGSARLPARLAPAGSDQHPRVVIVQALGGCRGCECSICACCSHSLCTILCCVGMHFSSSRSSASSPPTPALPLWAANSGAGTFGKRARRPKVLVDAALGNSRVVSREVAYSGAGSHSISRPTTNYDATQLRIDAANIRRELGLASFGPVSIATAAASYSGPGNGIAVCGRLQVLESILGEQSSFVCGGSLAAPSDVAGAVDYAAASLFSRCRVLLCSQALAEL